jgi:hypothetical protein
MNKRLKALKAALAKDIAKREKLELRSAPPTYPLREAMPVEEARRRVASDFDNLIREAEGWWLRHPPTEEPIENDNPFLRYAREIMKDDEEPPPVHAQRSPTGVGKTRIGAKEIAADRQRRDGETGPLATRPWGYFGPTHRLNESTAGQFEEAGLTARVYYGRTAWDRGIPGNEDLPEDERTLMCLAPERVAMAIAAHQSVTETCCIKRRRGGKTEECEHLYQCGYQRQFDGDAPEVWLAPHELLFHDPSALRELAGVIIDESFWSKGVYGVDERHWQIALDEMVSPPSVGQDMSLYPTKLALEGTLQRLRLVELLREHPLGGLQRERIVAAGITPEDCSDAIREEWKIVNRVKMSPEMTEEQVEEVKQLLPECRRARRMANVFRTLRELLEKDIKVSGRLVLARRDDKTILKVRGVREVGHEEGARAETADRREQSTCHPPLYSAALG